MGEDFIKRRNANFRRQRDEQLAAQLKSNELFDLCKPVTTTTIPGAVVTPGLASGAELWLGDNGVFFSGGVAAVKIPANVAADLARGGGTIFARVDAVADDDVAMLHVGRSG